MSIINDFITKHIQDEYGGHGKFTIYKPEECGCKICKALDMYGGYDYVVTMNGIIKNVDTKILISYAMRDQSKYDRAFKTFTIRYKTDLTQIGENGALITEWQKRYMSNILLADYSKYTMQVYQNDKCYFCGIALNNELNKYIYEFGDDKDEIREVNDPNFYFKVIDWDKYKDKGYYFKYYEILK